MIDSLEKYAEEKLFERSSDRIKFCKEYLEKRGFTTVKSSDNKSTILSSCFTLSHLVLKDFKNKEFLQEEVEHNLIQGIGKQIIKKQLYTLSYEDNLALDSRNYTMSIGVYKQ